MNNVKRVREKKGVANVKVRKFQKESYTPVCVCSTAKCISSWNIKDHIVDTAKLSPGRRAVDCLDISLQCKPMKFSMKRSA